MRPSILKSIKDTVLFSGILFCFVYIPYSCQTNEIEDIPSTQTVEQGIAICFKTSGTKFDKSSTKGIDIIKPLPRIRAQWGEVFVDVKRIEEEQNTKGTPITLVTNIADAGILAYASSGNFVSSPSTGITPNLMYNQQLIQTSGTWSYSPSMYWPLGVSTRTSFFAYSPYATGTNGLTVSAKTIKGTPYVSYSTPSNTANQPDLLIANQYNKVKADGVINFGFKHALAYIGFSLQGDNNLVKSIGIKGISTSGNVSLDESTITWSNLGSASTTALLAGINFDSGQSYVTATATQIPVTSLMQSSGYLMLIPQTLTSDTKIVVTMDDNSTREVAINTGTPAWEAGNHYVYNIVISPV